MDETIHGLTDHALSAAVATVLPHRDVPTLAAPDVTFDLGEILIVKAFSGPLIGVTDDDSGECVLREFQPHADHNDLHRVIEWMQTRGYSVAVNYFPAAPAWCGVVRNVDICGQARHASITTAVLRACLLAVRSEDRSASAGTQID